MATTMLANIINPEVMADMISAELPNALQVSGVYKVDRTLSGKAGNTITVPQWAYIGAAEDVAEGAASTVATMTATDKEYTVKKAVKNVEVTDEAVLSGYGDPKGEAAKQLRMAIADKVDNDGMALLAGITSSTTGAQISNAAKLDYFAVADAVDLFNDENQNGEKILLVNRAGLKALRKNIIEMGNAGVADMADSDVSKVAGCRVVISNKIPGTNRAYVLKPGAITAFIKRDVAVETDRDVTHKKTLISADEHYTCAIEDISKIVVITITPASAGGK